jgi:hypothetical protein
MHACQLQTRANNGIMGVESAALSDKDAFVRCVQGDHPHDALLSVFACLVIMTGGPLDDALRGHCGRRQTEHGQHFSELKATDLEAPIPVLGRPAENMRHFEGVVKGVSAHLLQCVLQQASGAQGHYDTSVWWCVSALFELACKVLMHERL